MEIQQVNNIFGIYDSGFRKILDRTYDNLLEAQQNLELIIINNYTHTMSDIDDEIVELKDKIDQLRVRKNAQKKPAPKKAPAKKQPPKKNNKKQSESDADESDTESVMSDRFEIKYEEIEELDDLKNQLSVAEYKSKNRYAILQSCKENYKIVTFTLV